MKDDKTDPASEGEDAATDVEATATEEPTAVGDEPVEVDEESSASSDLEAELAVLFAPPTAAEIAAVRALHAQMISSYAARDLEAYCSVNQKIHRAILKAARNDTLTTSCQALSLRMQRARYLANMSDERWAAAVQEHEKIMEYLALRDGKQLARTLLAHMRGKQASVTKWLQSQGGQV